YVLCLTRLHNDAHRAGNSSAPHPTLSPSDGERVAGGRVRGNRSVHIVWVFLCMTLAPRRFSWRILSLEPWEESSELCARIATMNGGARFRRALISQRQRSGLDGISPHPVHGQVNRKDRSLAGFT